MMLDRTLSRPRWAIPSTHESRPVSAAAEMTSSRIGIADSAPSNPYRLVPTYLVARNFSNASAALSRSRIRCLRALSKVTCTPSTLDWIQRCSWVSWMCMYSMPMVAVGVTQHPEQLPQRHLLAAGDPSGEKLAVEVPDRQPVGERIELGRHRRLFPVQRIEV